MAFFDERELKNQLLFQNAKEFYNFVSRYDEEMIPVMKAKGYTCIHSMEYHFDSNGYIHY